MPEEKFPLDVSRLVCCLLRRRGLLSFLCRLLCKKSRSRWLVTNIKTSMSRLFNRTKEKADTFCVYVSTLQHHVTLNIWSKRIIYFKASPSFCILYLMTLSQFGLPFCVGDLGRFDVAMVSSSASFLLSLAPIKKRMSLYISVCYSAYDFLMFLTARLLPSRALPFESLDCLGCSFGGHFFLGLWQGDLGRCGRRFYNIVLNIQSL
jgi:hypothetical protein